MRTLLIAAAIGFLFTVPINASAATTAETHSGKILLQVERNGEAWYIYPKNKLRYYLGRPTDAFTIMREFGLGISNADLAKIPTSDSSDAGDTALRQKLSGQIVLQVEKNGEAWYIYPNDLKRYYLGRPTDAFSIMRSLGLGIDNENLDQITPDRSFGPNQFHVSEGGYSFVFYGLRGNGDAGSWSFTPWGSQTQPFEYSQFTRGLPCGTSLYWSSGCGGLNTIKIGQMASAGLSNWLSSPGSWLTSRAKDVLATHDWNEFVNTYIDDWFHLKNSDDVEIFNHGDPNFPFKASDVHAFPISNYPASIMTVQTSAYENFYIRHKVILLTKDYVNVYYLDYQTWTNHLESNTTLDQNIADFERTAKTFTIL